jgi:cell pole-organizing protein PopZ
VPSVSATLGPHRRLEPLSDAFKPEIADHRSKPEVAPVNPFPSRDFGLSSEKPSPAEPGPAQPDAVLKPSLQLPSALPALLDTTANPAGDGDRAMEDAVADLLRPLLKTWLAENMPRILERALQREMTESLFPGEKNSRD